VLTSRTFSSNMDPIRQAVPKLLNLLYMTFGGKVGQFTASFPTSCCFSNSKKTRQPQLTSSELILIHSHKEHQPCYCFVFIELELSCGLSHSAGTIWNNLMPIDIRN